MVLPEEVMASGEGKFGNLNADGLGRFGNGRIGVRCFIVQFERQLTASANQFVVAVIRLHDALYERVAYHVFFVKTHKGDTLHALKHFKRVN